VRIRLVVGVLAGAVSFASGFGVFGVVYGVVVSVIGGLVVVAVVASVLASLGGAIAGNSAAPRLLAAAGALLPAGYRQRYLDEWGAELAVLPWWRRFGFTLGLLACAMPRMAITLRRPRRLRLT
jgi:hypothetical protein